MACISAKDPFERRIEEAFRESKRILALSGKYPTKEEPLLCPVYGTETCLRTGRSTENCPYLEYTNLGEIPCGQFGFLAATANRRRSFQPTSSTIILYSNRSNMCLG